MKNYTAPKISIFHFPEYSVRLQGTGSNQIALTPVIDGGLHQNQSGTFPTDFSGTFSIGDFSDNSTDRGFIGFDISSVSGQVTSAVLIVNQSSTSGTPYNTLGNLIADHVDFGGSVDAADFSGGTLQNNFGAISSDSLAGAKSLDVTAEVQNDISSSRTTSQFRLRFANDTDNDNSDDFTVLDSAESGMAPELIITVSQ